VNILHWWRDHERVLPLLSKLAKKVLTVPASSSKSERVFSTGGNFVTSKRNKIAPKKVEDLILIKENKSKIEEFKARGTYKLKRVEHNAFESISVDEVIANLFEEDEEALDILDGINEVEEEVVFFINDDSDLDDSNDEDDEEDIIEI
jgi:hypothetical protein